MRIKRGGGEVNPYLDDRARVLGGGGGIEVVASRLRAGRAGLRYSVLRNRRAGTHGWASLALAFLTFPSPALAQSEVRIQGECAPCRALDVRVVRSLGGPAVPIEFSVATSVAMDSRGRVAAASLFTPGALVVFDANGGDVRTVGRAGQGPGEYGRISRLASGPDDQLLIYDGRVTLLDADHRFVRTIRPAARVGAMTFTPEGGVTLLAVELDGGRAPRLHSYAPDGTPVASFAPPERPLTPDDRDEGSGALTPAREGGVWLAVHPRYEVTRFVAGEPVQRMVRDVDWYEPWSGFDPNTGAGSRPRPRVGSIWEDSDGFVWVASWVADANWVPRAEGQEVAISDEWDTMIEVLDAAKGRVVAQLRTDDQLWLLGDGRAYALREDVVGRILIDILELSLRE